MKILDFIKERGQEKSTILSVITFIAGIIGWSVAPEQGEAIAGAVASIITAIAVFTKEEK
jgi:hypothetical protein